MVVRKAGLFDGILHSLWIAIWRKLHGKVLPHIAHIIAATGFNVFDHILDGVLHDLGLTPRCLADALIVTKSSIAGAPRDFQSVKDLIVGESVAETFFDESDDLVVGSHPGAFLLILLGGQRDRIGHVASHWAALARAMTEVFVLGHNCIDEGSIQCKYHSSTKSTCWVCHNLHRRALGRPRVSWRHCGTQGARSNAKIACLEEATLT